MTATPAREILKKIARTMRESLLSINMIGLEASVTLEVILMIANIQTLGVPVQYSSLPSTIAAAAGIVLIPCLGFVVDNWASSKKSKAKILVMVNSIQISGLILVFAGNLIKLLFYDQSYQRLESNDTTHFPVSTMNFVESTTTFANNSTMEFDINSFSPLEPSETESVIIRYYAVFVMIGFGLTDCGYDSSNCILKTFALTCSPPEKHESNILRSIFVSSLGGCLVSVLGSVGLGDLLTAGTHHDSNAAQCAFLSALCLVLVLTTLSCTLLSGFCCPPSWDDSTYKREKDKHDDETSHLIPTSSQQDKSSLSASQRSWFCSHSSSFRMDDFLPIVPTSDPETIHVADSNTLPSGRGNKVLRLLKNKKKYFILNIASFFYFGGLYSFEVFAVNFVGINIFRGDPSAKTGTDEYARYIEGVKVGSQGTLTFYIAFTIFSGFLQPILDRVGKKVLFLTMSAVYIASNIACATTALLPIYFITAAFTGTFRSVVFSVPFIMANDFSKEESIRNNTPYNSGVAIAVVAAMLPCGFTVCSALMGPLIEATGNAATPLYYTTVNVFLGSVCLFFLKTSTE